ncbi:MAG: hypothetical protein LEGION0403_FIIPPAGN_02676 [Legionella sp.]|uniref:hypothetical protein n=1 Tax=Legionella sp. TaxID=459 RepID=UPI003D09AF59
MAKSKKHKFPSVKTIKELYANAYWCASPGCRRPLYKVDNETGVRTLNSNAAHICARSEGGPRWDPDQTEDENRSINNLLALCLEHAFEIDDIKKVSQYSIEKLQQWKKQQLADFDSLGKQGWSVRNEDIEQLRNPIDLVSVITLGGTGGTAPGAGGGGGGVLGSPYSKGGDGGKGGDAIFLNGRAGAAPGAGGGGAGALGKGAIGATGGEGGEIFQKLIQGENVHCLEFEIGKGGENGQDGGDTIVKIVNKEKKVIDTLGFSAYPAHSEVV